MKNEEQYLKLLEHILNHGRKNSDRTGTGTLSTFGAQLKFDLENSFPLITTKKIFWKGPVIELHWMLRGETNTSFLHKYGITIWDEWQKDNGDLGPVYGKQIRDFNGTDQLKILIERLKSNPNCRRHIISMWNPAELKDMVLPPCPVLIQFDIYDGKLNASLYQRSADMFLGVPFDLAVYSLFTYLLANEIGLTPGELTYTFGNAHIYLNHIEQVKEQLTRSILNPPTLKIGLAKGVLLEWINDCHEYEWKSKSMMPDFCSLIQLENYNSHPSIKGEVSV